MNLHEVIIPVKTDLRTSGKALEGDWWCEMPGLYLWVAVMGKSCQHSHQGAWGKKTSSLMTSVCCLKYSVSAVKNRETISMGNY